jgi:hypothetical protein
MNNIIKIAVFTLGICSCGRKDCGFPDENLNWVSYRENDSLFYSNNKDTIKLKVLYFNKTSPNYVSYLVMDVFCRDSAYYYTTEDLTTGYFINESYSLLGEPKMKMQITKNDIFNFEPSNYLNNTNKIEFHSDTTINSKNYHNVFLISKDTINSKPRIAWIIKSETIGIVAFYDFKNRIKWYLINK